MIDKGQGCFFHIGITYTSRTDEDYCPDNGRLTPIHPFTEQPSRVALHLRLHKPFSLKKYLFSGPASDYVSSSRQSFTIGTMNLKPRIGPYNLTAGDICTASWEAIQDMIRDMIEQVRRQTWIQVPLAFFLPAPAVPVLSFRQRGGQQEASTVMAVCEILLPIQNNGVADVSAASLLIYFNQPVTMIPSMVHKTRAVTSDGMGTRWKFQNACGDFAFGMPIRSKVLLSQI
ncbi:hypothetical protein ARMSODRAFT_1066324 [Armillaria solidipes]|uniref:Uncharacterized protein n=1 Tax=Armillaria solidipes TaxID=1076256 RepID=A0A2H3AT31_9AGAR|nr:hypothetical protein ARMSODRAFT_1066324 [Armillaria solidipes]